MGRVTKQKGLATGLLLLPALLQLFPLFYLICLSFKQGSEVFHFPPKVLPESWSFANYVTALERAPLLRFLVNSIVVSVAITTLQLLTSILAAYALARTEFRGRRLLLAFILATMMVPGEVTVIPNYFTCVKLGWLDRYSGLILPFAASGFGIFLLYGFFRSIPKELEESATLDGASPLRFLFQFMVPLSAPAIVAFAVYAFVNAWNQYLWPLVIAQSVDMQTAQIGIGLFRSQNESLNWGVLMAASAFLITPSLALFVATQKQFVRGVTLSGIKG